jgi:uncharacterized membrane protein
MRIVRSSHPIHFFSKKEKEKIVRAIRDAEKQTSGEIHVHLVRKTKKDILSTAGEIFEKIGMTKTKERNGVLIFFAVQSRCFAIVGDSGIHDKVPLGFWQKTVHFMEGYFHQDRFADGMAEAILRIGDKLKEYYPRESTDLNELSDKISYSL